MADKLARALAELGITPANLGAAQFSDSVAKQINDVAPAIKTAGVKP